MHTLEPARLHPTLQSTEYNVKHRSQNQTGRFNYAELVRYLEQHKDELPEIMQDRFSASIRATLLLQKPGESVFIEPFHILRV